MKRQAEHLRRLSRQHGGPVAYGSYAVEALMGQRRQRFRGFLAVAELHGHRMVAPWIVHHVASVGREREFNAQPARGFGEDANLIAGRGGEKQQPSWHERSLLLLESDQLQHFRLLIQLRFAGREFDSPGA